jgi:hypothetical protein
MKNHTTRGYKADKFGGNDTSSSHSADEAAARSRSAPQSV